MKKFIKMTFVSMMVFLLLAISILPAFAAETLTVNDVKAKKGDTISYDMYLGDCKEDVIGMQMYILYDQDYLKVDANSLEFPSLSGVVSNTDVDDTITFNWTNVSNTADFSKTKGLVSVDFEVIKDGKTEITYFITELYGDDMTYLKNYTITYDLSVNDKVKVDDEAPIVCEDENVNNQYQGQFINYEDGKGEENGDDDREAITGVTTAPDTSGADVVDVTKGDNNIVTVIIIVAAVLIVSAIVILIILRNHSNKNINEDN